MDHQEQETTFLLRLSTRVKAGAIRLSEAQGISLDQFITLAVTERLTRIATERQQALAASLA